MSGSRHLGPPVRALLHLGFLATGIGGSILGPLVPHLTISGLDPVRIGALFLIQFVASSVAAWCSTFASRWAIGSGYLALGGGFALLASGWSGTTTAAMVLIGLGIGASIPATNLIVAADAPDHRAAALAHLNLAWGVGALVSPLVVAAALTGIGLGPALAALAGASGLLGSLLLLPLQRHSIAAVVTATPTPTRAPAATLLPHALRLFLTIGTEATVGGWLVALSVARDIPTIGALGIGSVFWAAFVVARLVLPALLLRLNGTHLLMAALATALLGVVVVDLAADPIAIAAGAICLGLGLGPCFPLVVAELSAATATSGGWVFALGGSGAGVVPWLAGLVAGSSSMNSVFLVPTVTLIALAVLSQRLRRIA